MNDRLLLRIAPPPSRPSSTAPAAAATRGSSFRDALRDAAREMASREAILDRALRHGAPTASPEQLLALQATVHRHAQEVELAAKLVDKLTGAVRQVLTSQQ
ncbi:MAG: hypothetical protein OHK0013_40410 [Sandaracinaceae bacterium]